MEEQAEEFLLTKVKNGTESEFGSFVSCRIERTVLHRKYLFTENYGNPYAVYKDVGNWYDYNTKRTYKIDLKLQ